MAPGHSFRHSGSLKVSLLVSQIVEITLVNLRSLPSRLGSSLVICIGIAGVVAVLTSVLAMSRGLTSTLTSAGQPDRVIVLRKGALAESLSSLSREAVLAVETAPGISEVDGKLVSPEVVLSVNLPRSDEVGDGPLSVRGLGPRGRNVRSELKLVAGRFFEPGRHEVMVGHAAQRGFSNMGLGDVVTFHSNRWTVVGVFSTDGDVGESQLLTDAATLQAAANRPVFSSVTVRLADEQSFEAFQAAVTANPRLKVGVERETDYYDRQSEQAGQLLSFIAYVVSTIMAVGALCGALNTMYAAVSARTVEIATLRALGFGGTPVVISVLVEALLLAAVGAVIGLACAWLLFHGDDFVAGGTLSRITVALKVDGPIMLVGTLWALSIGLLGALTPAIRAARVPVIDALRVVV